MKLASRNENTMKKKTEKRERRDGLRREYDLSKLKGGVRGPPPHHARFMCVMKSLFDSLRLSHFYFLLSSF